MIDYIQHIVEDFDFQNIETDHMDPQDNVVFRYIVEKFSEMTRVKFTIKNVDPEYGIALTPVESDECIFINCEIMYNGSVEMKDKTLLKFIHDHHIYYIENSIFLLDNETGEFQTIKVPDFIDCIGGYALKSCKVEDFYLGKFTTAIGSHAFTEALINNLHLNDNIDPKFIHQYAFVGIVHLDNIFYSNKGLKQRFKEIKVQLRFLDMMKPEPKKID